MSRSAVRALLCVVALLAIGVTAASAAPIPDLAPTTLPQSMGGPVPATAFPATAAPQNPSMAPNPNSNIHNDTWMTDAYATRPGPLGNALQTSSGLLPAALCGSLTFDL